MTVEGTSPRGPCNKVQTKLAGFNRAAGWWLITGHRCSYCTTTEASWVIVGTGKCSDKNSAKAGAQESLNVLHPRNLTIEP